MYLHESNNGAESFLAHDLHRVINVDENLGSDISCALFRFGEVRLRDECASPLRDCDARDIRVSLQHQG